MKYSYRPRRPAIAALLAMVSMQCAVADSPLPGKIYHPYVQAGERELEFLGMFQNDDDRRLDNLQRYRLGYGQALTDHLFGEIIVTGEQSYRDDVDLDAMELEALWQITEQGEYAADWGMLFECARSFANNINECSMGVLVEKEFGRWVGTANMKLLYESGKGVNDEVDPGFAGQLRYRHSREFEPAVELYGGEKSNGVGLGLLGNHGLGGRMQVFWQAGVIAGLDRNTPATTARFVIELEF